MSIGVIEPTPIGRQIAATMSNADLQLREAFEITVEDQLPDAERGIERMSDDVREVMVAHASDQAGARRMQEDQDAEILHACEEFLQPCAGKVDAPHIGADLDAAKAEVLDRAVQFVQR